MQFGIKLIIQIQNLEGNTVEKIKGKISFKEENVRHKKRQAYYITPLRPDTLAVFPPWGIDQELVV